MVRRRAIPPAAGLGNEQESATGCAAWNANWESVISRETIFRHRASIIFPYGFDDYTLAHLTKAPARIEQALEAGLQIDNNATPYSPLPGVGGGEPANASITESSPNTTRAIRS